VGAVELIAGSTRLRIDESFGGRVASLLVRGPDPAAAGSDGDGSGEPLELAGRYQDSPHGWGAFPMAPWAGRVRRGVMTWRGVEHQLPVPKPPHAIHGTVARVPWEVVSSHGTPDGRGGAAEGQGAAGAVLRADLGGDWPWPGHAVLRYALEESSLSTTLEVHAEEREMPAWTGLHPWFPRTLRGQRVRISLAARAVLAAQEEGIPTLEEIPLPSGPAEDAGLNDTLAGVEWPVTLTWPGVAVLEVSADAPWAVVFTQREEAVCVEPQTAPPDATALGLEGLAAPGSPVVMTTTWRWRAGDGAGV
jgi:aldose 1-epimerase